MRITIESTVSEPEFSCKATVEVPFDDADLDAVQQLIDQLLRGFGFLLPNVDS